MLLLTVSVITLILDQASKMLIMAGMTRGQSIPVIDGIFHITYIHNPGAAFGLLANRTSFFIVVSLLAIAGAVFFYRKQGVRRGLLPAALGMIVGGALGNLVDRVRYGEVIDFIDFIIWPVFNLADTAIVVGAGLLSILLWKADSKP